MTRDLVDDILAALAPLDVRARAMFGGVTIYCDEKVVALVCDHRFYLKPGDAAEGAEELERGAPYPGAKEHLIVDERRMQDRAAFRALVQATADNLPAPRPRRPGARRPRSRRRKA